MLEEVKKTTIEKMQKTLDVLEKNFQKTRASRAHPSLLDQIQVDYYGTQTPLAQVANVSVENATTFRVVPWEKSLVAAVEKAIMTSELNLNPQSSGDVIRIHLPPLTQERRESLVRLVKAESEHAKVSIRSIRRDVNAMTKKTLKQKELSKDEVRQIDTTVQQLTDEFVDKINTRLAEKEKTLLEF